MPPSLPATRDRGPTATIDLSDDRATVFSVLTDPETYPDWLVGAHAIRSVEPGWPRPGTAFHHTVGAGPFKISDHTTALAVEEPERLALLAHVGPLLKAHIVFELADLPDGGTRLDIREKPEHGWLTKLWWVVGHHVVDFGIWSRNAVALDRLRRYLDEHRDHLATG